MKLNKSEMELSDVLECTERMNSDVGNVVKCSIYEDGTDVWIKIEYKE